MTLCLKKRAPRRQLIPASTCGPNRCPRPREKEEEEDRRKRRRTAKEKGEELDRLCNQAMDEEEELDRLCNEAMDRFEEEQKGEGFQFELYPHSDKRAKKFGVHRRVFTSRLRQPRNVANIPRANIPQLIERALQQAIAMEILDGHEQDNDILMINMSSNRLRHAYQSRRVTVGEWINNERNVQQLLEKIAQILNSNEQFQVDDSFHIEVAHIKDPGRGSGQPCFKLGTRHIEKALRDKRSVILINNQNDLCCARALVTLQALREEGNRAKHYNNIKRGHSEQKKEPKHSTPKRVFPKDLPGSEKSPCSKSCSPSIKSSSSPWIKRVRSFSKARLNPKTNNSFSSNWGTITMLVRPSVDFLERATTVRSGKRI